MNDMAILADKYTALPFRAMGIDTYLIEDEDKARSLCMKLWRSQYKMVFLQETWAEVLQDILQQPREHIFPLFIVIPDHTGSRGIAEKKIRQALEKALGTTTF